VLKASLEAGLVDVGGFWSLACVMGGDSVAGCVWMSWNVRGLAVWDVGKVFVWIVFLCCDF
jgi:hypothetical protein